MISFPTEVVACPVLDRVSEIWTPREVIRPSEWAERERFVSPEASPEPGQWRNDFLPWIKPILDALFNEPDKLGWVVKKYAQAGISELYCTLVGWFYCFMPGPTIYLCSRKDDARKFGIERFDYMIEQSRSLRKIFRRGKSHNETMYYKESSGGALTLGGAGSANDFISKPARHVAADEYDDIGIIPKHGDAWEVLGKRLGAYETRVRTTRCAWAHPTHPNFGIAKLYRTQTDQRTWMIRCPHCGKRFKPAWDQVKIDDGDPGTARHECPHCTKVITDAQRWQASRDGEFVSQLPAADQAKRRYIGFHISKLCVPRLALLDLAFEYCNCISEAQLRVFYNKVLGEEYLPASTVITEDMVRQREDHRHVDRTCPSDTLFVTAGVDVQKPKHTPTLYFAAVAWTALGTGVVLEYGRVRGWMVLHNWLVSFHSRKSDSSDELRISACAIDHGYETQQVYSFCRQEHSGVPCIPFKHTPGVTEDQPTRVKERPDPLRPELGSIKRIETSRTYWMDRALGRFNPDQDPALGGSIILPHGMDQEFVNHILASIRVEREDEHGHPIIDYVKEEGRRDDWLQCLVGAEIVAVARGLDKLHQLVPAGPPRKQREVAEGLVEPQTRERQIDPTGRYRRNRRSRGRRVW